MPARKRKAQPEEAETIGKKARKLSEEPESTLTSRPKRKSAAQEVAGSEVTSHPPKRRERPPKQFEEVSPSLPVRRGRPRKQLDEASPPTNPVAAPARPRGRPKRVTTQDEASAKRSVPSVTNGATATRPRGRPPKATVLHATITQPVKEPTKSATKKLPKGSAQKSTQTEALAKGIKPPGKRGRPPKRKPERATSHIPSFSSEDISGTDGPDVEMAEEKQDDRQYWLMKAEPNDRYENGVNVKFSIDDLAAAEAPEPWDGVRNYGARNNMRAMRKGDLAFFYHSNCQVPGIVGVMRIVQEHTPDQSAFDPQHPYYDPKSVPSSPKWDCVHVEFVKKFDTQITLKMMQQNRDDSGELTNMQLLKMGRLSVSAVSPREWRYILSIVKEDAQLGQDDIVVDKVDGYESDTDGETVPNNNNNNNNDDDDDNNEEVVNGGRDMTVADTVSDMVATAHATTSHLENESEEEVVEKIEE